MDLPRALAIREHLGSCFQHQKGHRIRGRIKLIACESPPKTAFLQHKTIVETYNYSWWPPAQPCKVPSISWKLPNLQVDPTGEHSALQPHFSGCSGTTTTSHPRAQWTATCSPLSHIMMGQNICLNYLGPSPSTPLPTQSQAAAPAGTRGMLSSHTAPGS